MFQQKVATRPSAGTPRASSADASRRTRTAHSVTVVVDSPPTVPVTIVLCPNSCSARCRTYGRVSGRSCMSPRIDDLLRSTAAGPPDRGSRPVARTCPRTALCCESHRQYRRLGYAPTGCPPHSLITSPFWSSLTTGHDPAQAIASHDRNQAIPAVTRRDVATGGRWITRLPASGLGVRFPRGALHQPKCPLGPCDDLGSPGKLPAIDAKRRSPSLPCWPGMATAETSRPGCRC